MPLHRWRIGACLAPLFALTIGIATPAHALRIVTYNLHQYPSDLTVRQPALRKVMAAINADVVIAQELDNSFGRDSFLINVLNNAEPGQWSASAWFFLTDEGAAIFYKPAKVALVGVPTIFPTSGPRDVFVATLKPVGYAAGAATFRIYSVHPKAGQTASDSTTRRLECTDIRNNLNTLTAGTNFLLGGDSNFYGSHEGGYKRLTESQLDNDGRLSDPLAPYGLAGPNVNWHANSGFGLFDTQCPCKTVADGGLGCRPAFSGGGMDDRFDLWLTSSTMADGEGLDYFEDLTISNGAYPYAYGNDGTKYNLDINAGGMNGMVGIAVANALHDASDHLPIVITLQLPARVAAASQLNFGSVIVDGAADQPITVTNGATAPADELDYTFTAPAGFSAPGGGFQLEAGASFESAISMSTASAGVKTGTMTLGTDDPDSLSKPVLLSGKVLRHAVASLDSAATTTATMVDFGDYAIGYFSDHMVRVHNRGFDALQARLSQTGANITGGDGRFSIVGGFSPTLVGSPAKTWNIHFNDAGATLDNTYTATLTFANDDEPLPGAAAASALAITLRAKPVSTTTGVPPGRDLPKTLAFYPPHPNPLGSETLFAYDLPAAGPVSLAIYDLSGRRVANLVSGTQEADRYQVRWDARAEGGQPVPAGLYFARFSTPGMMRLTRLIVLP